ncbi:hypothetical protein H7X87_02935 [Acetobacteraceae bacterium]|nr:hypothetical protein [Candidatus Parcubacteria bacterium]
MAGKDRDGMERLKRQLYKRDAKVDTGQERTKLSPDAAHAPTSWSDVQDSAVAQTPVISVENKEPLDFMSRKPSRSLAAKFLLGSFLFFLAASGVAAYMFFGGANLISPQNIDIEIIAPSLIDGGKQADFDVLIRNRNQTSLELVDLVIDYPDGARSSIDSSQELTHERQSIGTIAPGQQLKRTISAVLYGSEGVEQTLSMTLEYSVAGSNAVFEKKAEAKFIIGSSPVSLSISSPTEATAGEQFSMEVEVRSNALQPVSNVALQAQYPFGFSLSSTDPKPQNGSTLWRLGDLQPGESKKIRLSGSIEGQDGDERVFRFSVGSSEDATASKVDVPFLVTPQTLTIREPFISGSVMIGGRTGTVAANSGEPIQGTIRWKNNLSEPLSDVELSLSFSGPAVDFDSISAPTGFYQSSNSSLLWTKDKEASLENVEGGDSDILPFSFNTLPVGSGGVLITNPTINLNLTVRGVRQGGSGKPETVSSIASVQVELSSKPSLTAQTLHFSGPFQNMGSIPPRADSSTSYTILWSVKNSSNAVANATVSATLPPYVEFLSSQQGSGLSYNEGSRTVKWNIGDLKAGTGYTLPVRQAAFQIRLNPSSSQVGTAPALTGEAVLSGQDRFAQVNVQTSAPAATTNASGESGFSNGMDIVAPK